MRRRDGFVDTLDEMVSDQISRRGIEAIRTTKAMRSVDRRAFVPRDMSQHAFEDRPLAIGLGQTISQPYIVALMTSQFEDLPTGSKILEVGAGSGYQTAVLVAMGFEVHAIELEAKLVRRARRVLHSLGLSPSTLIAGDGRQGLPNHAPFDGVIAAACADGLPSSWKDQAGLNGRLVAPVETAQGQVLRRFDRVGNDWKESDLCGVLFVPLR